MSKISSIIGQDVEFMPPALSPGVLYVSNRFKTAAHLCACGCGTKVVTPLKPGGWRLSWSKGGAASLDPSIGNFNLPCKAHYWIRDGGIVWALPWTPQQIAAGRAQDHASREAHFDRLHVSWLRRCGRWIKRIFGVR